MAVHHPATTHPSQSFSFAEVFRVIGTTLVAGSALGYLLASYDGDTLDGLARVFGSVAMTTMVFMIFEARRRHRIDKVDERLDRIEQLLDDRLERQRQWRAYADVLTDLGGINGEDSGDISIEPRRG